MAKVSCILRHEGVQQILAYNWSRPAIVTASKGRGGMFLLKPRFEKVGLYWICHVLSSFSDSVTAKLKCILLYNFYVCGPTSMKLKLHLVDK